MTTSAVRFPRLIPSSVGCSRTLRHRRSFPTRRSSDLAVGGDHSMTLPILRAVGGDRPVTADRAQDRQRDRKSTRLNSSHTVISYAVFCLKKKTNIDGNITVEENQHVLIINHYDHALFG